MDKDKYVEQIVKKEPTIVGTIAKFFSYIVTAFGVYALFSSTLIGTVFVMLGAGLIYITGMLADIEYEYLFVNSDCEISKIYKKSSRRKCASFDGSKVDRVVPCSNERFANDLQVKRDWIVSSFVSGKKDAKDKCYGFVYTENDKQKVVILELDEKTVEYVSKAFKYKIEK